MEKCGTLQVVACLLGFRLFYSVDVLGRRILSLNQCHPPHTHTAQPLTQLLPLLAFSSLRYHQLHHINVSCTVILITFTPFCQLFYQMPPHSSDMLICVPIRKYSCTKWSFAVSAHFVFSKSCLMPSHFAK